jgi:hypothetical protein
MMSPSPKTNKVKRIEAIEEVEEETPNKREELSTPMFNVSRFEFEEK